MRRLIESTLVSLDGVVEAPERWASFDAEATAEEIEAAAFEREGLWNDARDDHRPVDIVGDLPASRGRPGAQLRHVGPRARLSPARRRP